VVIGIPACRQQIIKNHILHSISVYRVQNITIFEIYNQYCRTSLLFLYKTLLLFIYSLFLTVVLMNATGSVVLLVAVGLLVLVGAVAVNDLHQEAMSTNDTNIQQQASISAAIEKPLLMLFSGSVIIISAYCTINAFSKM
jgi:prepilin signal peptidase PulO-like enzyme (type II secretory pathway)